MRRRIIAFGPYYHDFMKTLSEKDCIVVLFHGFQKKTQKTPQSEIKKALKIRAEYYEYKKELDH